MKIILKYIFFAFFLSLNSFVLKSQKLDFSHISIQDGLSHSTVYSIAQDASGCMWFATMDGLNKYNGYNFQVYRHEDNDSTSIISNQIRSLKIIRNKELWIASREGLSFFDAEKDRFKNYIFRVDNNIAEVYSFIELENDKLLVGTSSGMRILDCRTGIENDLELSDQMRNILATTMTRVEDVIYVGTNNGLYLYHIQQKSLKAHYELLKNVRIQCILKQTNTRVWIATEGEGLFLINPRKESIKQYKHNPLNLKSISSDYIRSLAMDAQNNLWIGTFNDLNIYKESTDSFLHYSHDPLDETSLSQNSIRSLYFDSQGGMWLGTFFGGLNYYHPLKNRFQTIKQTLFENSLSDNVISCITEDSEHNLWIGTNDGGLNRYNPQTKHFKHYSIQNTNNQLKSNNVKSIFIDEENKTVYFGMHAGGLAILNLKNQQIHTLLNSNSGLIDNNVYSLLPYDQYHLWVGTLKGLQLFDIKDQSFVNFSDQVDANNIMSLYRDKKERLWIGTDQGLQVYKVDNQRLTKLDFSWSQKDLYETQINCIFEDKLGHYWIGTNNGLFGIYENEKFIKSFSTKNGLPNDMIHGILEDSFGRLWISSNHGLSCLLPESGKVRTFTSSEWIQSDQFTNYAYYRSLSGNMYFGGIQGISYFKPELLMDNPHMPIPVIDQLKLFNKVVRPDDETGILKKSISITDTIVFQADQSSFALDFVVSNYIAGKHNLFAYRLDGYESEWIYTSDVHQVSYSNLPAGSYTFFVKAANNDGRWNETPRSLHIVIKPFWYHTWWATFLFCLAIISLISFILRYFWEQKSMKSKIELEHLKQTRNEEMSQMKMRFFINMSHELRTPLTLIKAPLEELLQRSTDKWVRSQLEYVNRNANRLLRIVNQLMDYRRAELGIFELQASKIDVHNLIKDQFLAYEKLARKKQIQYTFTSDIEDKLFLADPNYLELIINNLLSNAFKYTPNGKSIQVILTSTEASLIVKVQDHGIGIAKDKQEKIFERFYQIDSMPSNGSSGIGLSLVKRLIDLHHATISLQSELGEGSCFVISIPQNETLYSSKELVTTPDHNTEVIEPNSTSEQVNKDFDFVDSTLLTKELNNVHMETITQKRGLLLIVEDNQEIANYLSEGLSSLFDVKLAANGEDALQCIKDAEPDVIVTDVMMPIMDGIKLTRTIKQNLRTCHIPVIILSAKNDVKDQLDALQVGADDYIPKPFSLAILKVKIQNLIRTRHRIFEFYAKSLEIEPQKISFNMMDEEMLKRAMDIVNKNMDNIDFSADDFARDMNMSRSNLHLKLKAITGESTSEFIRKIRFKKACELLEDGRYTVAEVSLMVGFNTPSYFATCFKKYFGYLPTEYIKNRRS